MRFHSKDKERTVVLALLFLFFVSAVVILFHSVNSFGGGDHFSHYKIARWSWKYPHLLLDEWGKPVFTLFVSPFAQLGMNFARLYNVIAGLLTAWFSWKLADRLNFRYRWLAVLFVLFTPLYFIQIFAVLTETTFSLLLMISLVLFFREKYIWTAIVVSFFPLARTESIVLIPLFILAFSFKKQYKALPFLFTGFLIYSLAGWPYYKNFWWLITEMPYKGNAAGIYGHGTLFHFVEKTKYILGYPLAGLFIIGTGYGLWLWIKRDHGKLNRRFYFLLLVPGAYLLYLAAHSYVWWKGIGNSLGLIRVMGAVTPLAALTAVYGMEIITKPFCLSKKISGTVIGIILLWVMYTGSTTFRQNFHASPPQQLKAKACRYLQTHHLDCHKIYYFANDVPIALGIDPFDGSRSAEGLPAVPRVSETIPDSSIIVWDAHFGPQEGHTPLKKLLEDKGLTLLKVFSFGKNKNVLSDNRFKVCVFQKNEIPPPETNPVKLDFEDRKSAFFKHFSTRHVLHGRYALQMDSTLQFSPSIRLSYRQMKRHQYRMVKASVWIFPEEPVSKTPCSLVISYQRKNKPIKYFAYDFNSPKHRSAIHLHQWSRVTVFYLIPAGWEKDDELVVYLWNRGKVPVYFDDLTVTFFSRDEKTPR